MYIYEAKGLVVADAIVNGLILTPEKDGKDPFTPAAVGDTCVLLTPRDNGDNLGIDCVDDYVVSYSDSDEEAFNSGLKIFAYQGEVFSSDYQKLKGLIFKCVRNQEECSPSLTVGDTVYVIADYIYDNGEWVKQNTPIRDYIEVGEEPEGPVIVSFTIPQKSYYAGETAKVTCETYPSDLDVTFSSSDDTIATIDEGGNVEFLKAGTVQFTAESDVLSATISDVTVNDISISLNKDTIFLGEDSILGQWVSTETITATKTPSTGTITWESSDTSIATVDQSGVVTTATPHKEGTCTITATLTVGSVTKSATCSVEVRT